MMMMKPKEDMRLKNEREETTRASADDERSHRQHEKGGRVCYASFSTDNRDYTRQQTRSCYIYCHHRILMKEDKGINKTA